MVAITRITKPTRHAFKTLGVGSEWLGPPDETCHWCGCDPRNIIHDVEVEDMPDESVVAQRDRAVDALRAVLKRLVNRRDHMFSDEQQVLNEADALCVESESW